jgi:hypothetical protein
MKRVIHALRLARAPFKTSKAPTVSEPTEETSTSAETEMQCIVFKLSEAIKESGLFNTKESNTSKEVKVKIFADVVKESKIDNAKDSQVHKPKDSKIHKPEDSKVHNAKVSGTDLAESLYNEYLSNESKIRTGTTTSTFTEAPKDSGQSKFSTGNSTNQVTVTKVCIEVTCSVPAQAVMQD